MLAAMKRHRDDPGFVQRMQDRVSARADARKIVYEKRKENNPVRPCDCATILQLLTSGG